MAPAKHHDRVLAGHTPCHTNEPSEQLLLESSIGDHVMAFYHAIGEPEGRPCEEVTALAMRVDADGKMTEVWFLAREQAARDAFWSALP